MAFASPLFWQIRYLVSNLTKKNQPASVTELNQLVALYGYDARVFLLSCLIDETDFSAKNVLSGPSGAKDLPKVALLHTEVAAALKQPGFALLILAALDGAGRAHEGRSRSAPASPKVTEENFLANFCKALKLPLQEQLDVAIALARSDPPPLAAAGMKHLRLKLTVAELENGGSLTPETVYALVHLLRVHPGLAPASIVGALYKHHPGAAATLACRPLLEIDQASAMNFKPHPSPATATTTKGGASTSASSVPGVEVDAAGLLQDVGYAATHSTAVLKALLQEAAASSSSAPSASAPLALSPNSIARLLLLVATTMDGSLESDLSAVLVNAMLPEGIAPVPDVDANENPNDNNSNGNSQASGSSSSSSAYTTWNVDVLVEVLRECAPKKQERAWLSVVSWSLDQADLVVADPYALQVLTALFDRLGAAAGGSDQKPLSLCAAVLARPWPKNPSSQLSLLEQAVSAAPDIWSFASGTSGPLPNVAKLQEDNDNSSSSAVLDAWHNPNLVRLLLALGEGPCGERAKDLLDRAARACPDTLFLVLGTSCADLVVSTRSRVANAVVRDLLPLFFMPSSSSSSSGNHHHQKSLLLVQRLWAVNSKLVLRCCRAAYEASPTAPTVEYISGLMREVPNGGPELMGMPQRELVLGVVCVMADRKELDLESWVSEHLGQAAVAEAVLAFVARHASAAVPRSAQASTGALATLESLAAILKALDKKSSPSPEMAQRMEQVIGDALRAQPQLASVLSQSSSSSSSSSLPGAATTAAGGAVQAAGTDGAQKQQAPPGTAAASEGAGSSRSNKSGGQGGSSGDEIEEMANSYFQKIYTSEQSIAEVIEMLKRFKSSPNQREQEIFACMIHNLFDEYRFFHKYPEKELRITGILFGTLIQHQLVSSMTLGIALRYVLDALRKPSWQNGKMFRFGMFALDQFKPRLSEWPQYCSHVVQIEYLNQHHKDLVSEIRQAMMSAKGTASNAEGSLGSMEASPAGASSSSSGGDSSGGSESSSRLGAGSAAAGAGGGGPGKNGAGGQSTNHSNASSAAAAAASAASGGGGAASGSVAGVVSDKNVAAVRPVVPGGKAEVDRPLILATIMPAGADPLPMTVPPESVVESLNMVFNNVSMQNLDVKVSETKAVLKPAHVAWFGNYLVVKLSTQPNFHALYLAFLLKLDSPGLVAAVLAAAFHNVSKLLGSQKITTSSSERSVLKNLGSWLGQMTLARNRPIMQRKLDVKELLCQGYETGRLIAVTPFVAKVMEGAKDSRVFRPPNPWTMALMGLLRELYEMNDLKLNIKFEIEVLCKHLSLKIDDVPPLRILGYARLQPHKDKTPDFNVRPSALSQQQQAAAVAAERHKGGNVHDSGDAGGVLAGQQQQPQVQPQQQQALPVNNNLQLPPPQGASAGAPLGLPPPSSGGAGASGSGDATSGLAGLPSGLGVGVVPSEQTVIPNLGAYVTVHPSLSVFHGPNGGALKAVVPVAVDRAIRDIIQPVVERSVTIACITTKELVVKDFALEGSEAKMRSAAQLMVSNLAGSLAVVTCKEPLRLSMATQLRNLLTAAATTAQQQAAAAAASSGAAPPVVPVDFAASLEQAVQTAATDNLELGCLLIEKAATETAIRDVEESLSKPLSERRQAAQQNQGNNAAAYVDPNFAGKRYPKALPEMLRPTPRGLGPSQLLVYEAFARQPPPPAGAAAAAGGAAGVGSEGGVSTGSAPDAGGAGGGAAASATMDASQAMAVYGRLVTALEASLSAVVAQAGPQRAPSLNLAVLGADHEVCRLVRQSAEVAAQIAAAEREAAVFQFARTVFFKKIAEQSSRPEEASLLRVEAYVGVLGLLKSECPKLVNDCLGWVAYLPVNDEADCKLHRNILVLLTRTQLCRLADLDAHLASKTNAGASLPWVDVSMQFAKQCVLERLGGWDDFGSIFDVLGKAAQRHSTQVARQVTKFMEELRQAAAQLAASQGAPNLASLPPLVPGSNDAANSGGGGALANKRAASLDSAREQVTFLLERWIRVWNESGGAEAKCVQFIALLHQQHVLASEETTDVFLRLATELCVEACLKTAHQAPAVQGPPTAGGASAGSSEDATAAGGGGSGGASATGGASAEGGGGDGKGATGAGAASSGSLLPGTPQTQLVYTVIDAFSNLLVILVKYAAADPQSAASRVNMLNRVLATVDRALLVDCNNAAASGSSNSAGGANSNKRAFDQRPYFRVFMNLLKDLNATDPVMEQNNVQVLGAFANAWHGVQPAVAPAFAFAWLELVSHRTFMPALLLAKPAQKGWMLMHRLLVALFTFLEPFLRRAQLPAPVRTLYKGTLRVLLVLLHDFPEFLCDYHFSFCDVVPPNCIQLRNLFLSAFPRSMRLPDPFTPNLKVDLLPEIAQHPRILSNIVASLAPHNLRQELDAYLKVANASSDSGDSGNNSAANAAAKAAFLEWLPARLRFTPQELAAQGTNHNGCAYNVPAINSLVVYVGAQGLAHLQNKQLKHSPVMEIFTTLLAAFNAEGRYFLLNAIANQLRYPNNHTHYFSCVLLFLFAEASSDLIKEQVTRVLLERLIVHRPHPWGLLITFIELIKNPRYNFWAHQFTHCAPEIERVFESVARSCMGPQSGSSGAGGAGGAIGSGGASAGEGGDAAQVGSS